jgi:hypothetical protein
VSSTYNQLISFLKILHYVSAKYGKTLLDIQNKISKQENEILKKRKKDTPQRIPAVRLLMIGVFISVLKNS